MSTKHSSSKFASNRIQQWYRNRKHFSNTRNAHKTLLHSAGGHQGSRKAHQSGNQEKWIIQPKLDKTMRIFCGTNYTGISHNGTWSDCHVCLFPLSILLVTVLLIWQTCWQQRPDRKDLLGHSPHRLMSLCYEKRCNISNAFSHWLRPKMYWRPMLGPLRYSHL